MKQFLTGVPTRPCADLYVTSEHGATLTLRDREGRPNVIITAHTSLHPKIIVATGGRMVDLIEMLVKLDATVRAMSGERRKKGTASGVNS
jgi:hypothetical protein